MFAKSPRILVALGMLLPVIAHAHPAAEVGHTHAVLQGVLHPLTGLDHLVFMLALGIYAAYLPRRLCAVMGVASMVAIIFGAAPHSGIATEVIEFGVLASLAVMGVALASRREVSAWITLPVATALSFLHGLAHAESVLDGVSRLEFIAGLVLTSGVLFSVAALLFRNASAKNPALQYGPVPNGPTQAKP